MENAGKGFGSCDESVYGHLYGDGMAWDRLRRKYGGRELKKCKESFLIAVTFCQRKI